MKGKLTPLVLLVGLAVLGLYLVTRDGSDDASGGREPVPTRTERPAGGSFPDDRAVRAKARAVEARAVEAKTERQKILEELKERWAVLKPRGNSAIKEQNVLAQESAELLGCSEEAITLMIWLRRKEQRYGEVKMRGFLERSLKSPDAGALREMLTMLPSNPKDSGKDGHYAIHRLCNAAGQGCPEEDFEAFTLALQDGAYAQEATLGRNLVLMRTDPKAGIVSTLEIFEGDQHSVSKWDHLNRQLREDFPEGVDFAELEQVLPESGIHADRSSFGPGPIETGRRRLMGKWAETDLDAAADYLVRNSDRLDVGLMKTVVDSAKFGSPEEAVAWVEGVEEGSYFDQAVLGSLFYLHFYDQPKAVELARRIGDPELRAEGVKRAEKKLVLSEGG